MKLLFQIIADYALQLRRDERGVILVLWALLLPAMLGFAGLGLEVGTWYLAKGDMQKAADAAAIGAAYAVGGSKTLLSVAQAEAARNGYGATSNTTLTVHNPPTSGAYLGNAKAVEVTLSQSRDFLFAKQFMNGSASIGARAVGLAPAKAMGAACVLALKTVQTTVTINGNADIKMPDCTVAANSTNSQSILLNGSAKLTAKNVYTAGNWSKNGSSQLANTDPNITFGSPLPDPYANLLLPTYSGCNYTSLNVNSGSRTLQPGTYCSGLTINAGANVTLAPGTYIFDRGALNINGNATINGTGVTIILTSSTGSNIPTFNLNGGSTMNLSAPSTGTYAGILMYQDRRAGAGSANFNGGSTMKLTGALYFPKQELIFNGGNQAQNCTKLVADSVRFNGGANFTNACPAGYADIPVPTSGTATTGAPTLVE